MDVFANLALGFQTAVSPTTLLYCFIGVFVGMLIGVLPGIGALATISLLLPVTYHLDPTSAIVMLAGVYYGAQYGGSTASILLNLPGTPSSAVDAMPVFVTVLQAHPLQGEALAEQVRTLTEVIARVLRCDPRRVHVQIAPAAAGRQAFGGRLVQ